MRTKFKLGIFVTFQPLIFMFDRFLYTFLYSNGYTLIQISILEIVYISVALATMFFVGNYPDVVGKKRMMAGILSFYSVFPLLYTHLVNFANSVVLRALEGLKHPYFPLYQSTIQDMRPDKGRAKYFGSVSAVWGFVDILMFLAAGVIIEMMGFGILAALNFLVIAGFCIFFLKTFPDTTVKARDIYRRISFRVVKNRFIVAYSVYQFIIMYVFITGWIYIPIKSFDLTSNFIGVGLVLFSGNLMWTICQIPFGMIADKVGVIKIYAAGIVLAVVVSLMLGLVKEGIMMVFVNLLSGIAASMTSPAEQALISENIPNNRRAEFNNIVYIVSELGAVFGVLLSMLIVTFFGMDYVFYMQSVVFLIAPIAFFATYRIGSKRSSSLAH